MTRTVLLSACRHAKKARINSADVLADALDKTFTKLKAQLKSTSDLDADIQVLRSTPLYSAHETKTNNVPAITHT